MPLSMLEVVAPGNRIVEQPIEVSGFGGSAYFILGYFSLDLTIRSIRAANQGNWVIRNSERILVASAMILERNIICSLLQIHTRTHEIHSVVISDQCAKILLA